MKEKSIMNRSTVICHMYVSLDGKIDGRYMDEDDRSDSGEFYDTAIWEMGNANANGRHTAQMYFAHDDIDYGKYDTTGVVYEDHVIRSDYYWVIFDRKGSCNWGVNEVTYSGKTARVVMVLTKRVKKAYLAHLRALGIAYVFAGDDEMDLHLALQKLKADFGIDNLILCGGAEINGAFHEAGLIDEISLVMAPYIEGSHSEKGFAELNGYIGVKYAYESINAFSDGGIHLRFKAVK